MPRTAMWIAGRRLVDHAAVEDDRAVGAALVLVDEAQHVRAADLLLALEHDAHVHRQLARARELAGDVQERQEVALVVARAARVQPAVAHHGLERVGRPELARIGRLHVVVAVDQHGRRVGAARAQLADARAGCRSPRAPRRCRRRPITRSQAHSAAR